MKVYIRKFEIYEVLNKNWLTRIYIIKRNCSFRRVLLCPEARQSNSVSSDFLSDHAVC